MRGVEVAVDIYSLLQQSGNLDEPPSPSKSSKKGSVEIWSQAVLKVIFSGSERYPLAHSLTTYTSYSVLPVRLVMVAVVAVVLVYTAVAGSTVPSSP